MCINIINQESENKYNSKVPLEEQICDSSHVVINYDPKDCFEVDRFISEMKRLRDTGISVSFDVTVHPNKHVHGMRTKKDARKLAKDIGINEVIKLLVTLHHTMDKTLEELSSLCCK